MLRLVVQFWEPKYKYLVQLSAIQRSPSSATYSLRRFQANISGTMLGTITLSALNPFGDSSTTNNMTAAPTSRRGPDRWQLGSAKDKNKDSEINTDRNTTTLLEQEEDEFVLVDKKRGGMFDYWVPYNDHGESLRREQGRRTVKVSRRLQFTLVNGLYFGSCE